MKIVKEGEKKEVGGCRAAKTPALNPVSLFVVV
jgi:hypothetical protein